MLDDPHANDLAGKQLPDGRYASIMAMTYGKVRLVVSPSKDALWYDDGW